MTRRVSPAGAADDGASDWRYIVNRPALCGGSCSGLVRLQGFAGEDVVLLLAAAQAVGMRAAMRLGMPATRTARISTLMIEMQFTAGALGQALRLLVSCAGRTEANPGCLEAVVAQDAAREGCVRYSEAWKTKGAFIRHLRSTEFRRVLAAMDMCREVPQVTIGNLTGRKGIDHLEELRAGLPARRRQNAAGSGADQGGAGGVEQAPAVYACGKGIERKRG